MNVLRACLAILASVSVIISVMLSAMDFSTVNVLLPVAIAGVCYGLLNSFELLFALAVFVKLKADLYEQHKQREALRSQRLRKARR